VAEWTRRRLLGAAAAAVTAAAAGTVGARALGRSPSPSATQPAPTSDAGTTSAYVDPAQLEVPWPDHSFLRQPWRGYLETVPAHGFVTGDLRAGLNFNLPAPGKGPGDAAVCRMLRASGITTVRLEIGWNDVDWDETGVHVPPGRLAAFAEAGIRPLILLNANHGGPCPSRGWNTRVRADAAQGARTVYLEDVRAAVPGYTGLSNLTGYWMAEVLFTAVDPGSGRCDLSRPLPKALRAGQGVRVDRLKYRPLNRYGTADFAATAAGWLRYVDLVCAALRAAGVPSWDVEIWNELTFGSNFLDINRYYSPALFRANYEFPGLFQGQPAWELARMTIDHLRQAYPGVGTVWGFSNTTFFHTPVAKLPADTGAQSYHPYGTDLRFPKQEEHTPNVDGYTPAYTARIAEGVAATFIQTESVIRLIQPAARSAHPPDVAAGAFRQYFTEHGFAAKDLGITSADAAWRARTKFLLRNLLFWCNKGLSGIWFYAAHDGNPLGMGFLDGQDPSAPTPPLQAWRDVLRTFGDTSPLDGPDQHRALVLEQWSASGPPRWVFTGDGTHPGLSYAEVLAFLPFQATPTRFVVAVYVMTQDFPADMAPQTYRLQLAGLPAGATLRAGCRDPLAQQDVPVRVVAHDPAAGRVLLELDAVDYPRLLTLAV
jgi:hypothetical protein